jgi:hypothetical protein
VALLAVAATATLVLHRETLGYGFDYDDYHFVRPYARSEVLAAFHGPWDAAGIEVPFYRPLTVALFAARFELFGVNADAYHALSLALTAIAAALAGLLAWQISTRAAGGVLAALLLVAHPALPYSLVAWVTNQMHGIETIAVLCGLTWWHAVRRRPLVWWIPLLALGPAAFLIKEDGIMLLPAVVVIHTLTRWIDPDDTPRIPAWFLGVAIALPAALFLVRREFLHGLGGYHQPTVAAAWSNLTRGLIGVFSLTPADRPWQPLASWLATLLLAAGLLLWRRAGTGTRRLFITGACIAVLFDLPFLFVVKAEQLHLVALGAVLVLTASIMAVADALRGRGLARIVPALAAVTLGSFGLVARDIAHDFDPFGPVVLAHDNIVKDWAAVPPELRDYLIRKRDGDSRVPANPAEAVPVVAFNMHLPEMSRAGVRYRWVSSPSTDVEISPAARDVTIPLRHEIGAFREPAHVSIYADGRRVDDLTLRDDDWHMSRFAVRPSDVSRLRRMHRVYVNLDRVWRPQALIPGSQDTRTLGVQMGEIQIR